MSCRNPSETVTHLALLNRHIYNIIKPISKLHVYLFTVICISLVYIIPSYITELFHIYFCL
jgi:hypothetical protein